MTNGPTDWNRGRIGAPSKEGHGVIIQANKGRSRQDYRVPRAALHPVVPPEPPRPPAPSSSSFFSPPSPYLPIITGPNCSSWHPLLSARPLSRLNEMPPASLLYVSFLRARRWCLSSFSSPPSPCPPSSVTPPVDASRSLSGSFYR